VASDDQTAQELFGGSMLRPIVEQLLGRRLDALVDWHVSPVSYTSFLSGRTLQLYSGTALAERQPIPWRMILKIIRPPDGGRTFAPGDQFWAREVDAYQSGLLDQLPGNLRAPRTVHIATGANGAHWLWLEHVTDLYDRHWPLAAFGLAARHLGQFNGAYLTVRTIPTFSWLMPNWAESSVEPARLAAAGPRLEEILANPRLQSAFQVPITARARSLLRDQPRYLTILANLPQTLCHHDAAQANLLASGRVDGEIETVAIDWESIGPGAIGADLASLVFGTMRRGDFNSANADDLERAAWAGYLDGLRDAGWDGPARQVRLGYTAAIALRWSLLYSTLRAVVDETARSKAANDWRMPPDQLLRRWIPLCSFLLDRADEVNRLTQTI
jgi:hypothetical protein